MMHLKFTCMVTDLSGFFLVMLECESILILLKLNLNNNSQVNIIVTILFWPLGTRLTTFLTVTEPVPEQPILPCITSLSSH